jgi:hypothetical protein
MLKGFFDETGIHNGSSITGVGGFVGTSNEWDRIEPKWWSVLGEYADKGVRSLHMTDAVAQRNQFQFIEKPHLEYILTQLTQQLGSQPLTAFFAAVVNEDWEATVKDPRFLDRFPQPVDLCFENIVHNLWIWARNHANGELVVPMFAYHTELQPRMNEISRLYGAKDWYRDVLGPLVFDYADRVVGLQAADFLAHQMRWDSEKRVFGPFTLANMGPTRALENATRGNYIWGNLFDRDGLQLTMTRFKEAGYPSGPVDLFSRPSQTPYQSRADLSTLQPSEPSR